MNRSHEFVARVEWAGSTGSSDYGRDHTIHLKDQTVRGSAIAQYGGDPALANPEQLLAAALAQCQMLTYLALAAKAGIEVVAYRDRAEASVGRLEGKTAITRVALEPHITLAPSQDADTARALVEKAHKYCFIANSLRAEVVLAPTVEYEA